MVILLYMIVFCECSIEFGQTLLDIPRIHFKPVMSLSHVSYSSSLFSSSNSKVIP